jgi:hypothetical protein
MTALADTFMKIMSNQPLSLALVVVVLLLLYMMNKQFNAFTTSRTEASQMIVQWQKETQTILAGSVSGESLKMILDALERDRETYRAMLPTYQSMPDQIQKVTETMIADRDKETTRMQVVIDKLEKERREKNHRPPPSSTETPVP